MLQLPSRSPVIAPSAEIEALRRAAAERARQAERADRAMWGRLATIPKPVLRTPRQIAERAIAWHHPRVTVADVMSRSKKFPVVDARQDAMAAVALAFPRMTDEQIARMFGRDRSTVWHALKKRGVK